MTCPMNASFYQSEFLLRNIIEAVYSGVKGASNDFLELLLSLGKKTFLMKLC